MSKLHENNSCKIYVLKNQNHAVIKLLLKEKIFDCIIRISSGNHLPIDLNVKIPFHNTGLFLF